MLQPSEPLNNLIIPFGVALSLATRLVSLGFLFHLFLPLRVGFGDDPGTVVVETRATSSAGLAVAKREKGGFFSRRL